MLKLLILCKPFFLFKDIFDKNIEAEIWRINLRLRFWKGYYLCVEYFEYNTIILNEDVIVAVVIAI